MLNHGGLTIEYTPGDSFETGDPENPRSRAEAREDAIKQFQRAAQAATIPQIVALTQQLLGFLIQFRAVGGTMAGSPIPNQLREAADFMEDVGTAGASG